MKDEVVRLRVMELIIEVSNTSLPAHELLVSKGILQQAIA